jgi:UDP-glucose 4-epimerase
MPQHKSAKILVTGGAGYIGSHTIIDLIDNGFTNIVSVDNFTNSEPETFERIEKITGFAVKNYNLNLAEDDLSELFQTENFDAVIHFAALKAVGESEEKPLLYYKNNISGLINLLEKCIEFNTSKFIFSSSCTVYGNPEKLPVNEKTPVAPKPLSVYGNTKKIGEEILNDVATKQKNINVVALRYFNPVGAHPSGKIGELPKGVPNNLIPFITQTAAGIRERLTVFGDDYNTPDGSCIRDYIHVMDIAHAHTLALEYLLKNKNSEPFEVFNLGSGTGVSVLEIIKAFEEINNVQLNYIIGNRRPGDVEAVYSDSSKALKILGWQPQYTLEDMVLSAWKWQQQLSAEK